MLSVYVCVWGVWGVIHSKRGECEDEKHVVIDAHDLIRCGAMRGRFLLESPWFLWRLLCHVHPGTYSLALLILGVTSLCAAVHPLTPTP